MPTAAHERNKSICEQIFALVSLTRENPTTKRWSCANELKTGKKVRDAHESSGSVSVNNIDSVLTLPLIILLNCLLFQSTAVD